MGILRKFLLLTSISAALVVSAAAQSLAPDDDDNQLWNDLLITIPVTKRVEVLILATARIDRNFTNLDEARLGTGVSVKVAKAVSLLAGYQHIEVRGLAGNFRTEHRYTLRGGYKFPIKKFGLSHKSTYEYRVRNAGNSWRYRPSIIFEKKLPEGFIPKAKVFITEEPFYVSTTRKFSRNRLSFGVSKTINPHLTLDVYYLRQDDHTSLRGNADVLGTAWRVHL